MTRSATYLFNHEREAAEQSRALKAEYPVGSSSGNRNQHVDFSCSSSDYAVGNPWKLTSTD